MGIWGRMGRALGGAPPETYPVPQRPPSAAAAPSAATPPPLAADRVLAGHTDIVTDLAFTPDGTLATCSLDGTVRLWDAGGGSRVLTCDADLLVALAIRPGDGAVVAQGFRDDQGLLQLWDTTTGEPRLAVTGVGVEAEALAVSPDGTAVALSALTDTILVWDLATGLPAPAYTAARTELSGVAFSPDGSLLAAVGTTNHRRDDPAVQIWDGPSRRLLRRLGEDTCSSATVAFSADGRLLAVEGRNGSALLLDAATGATVHEVGNEVMNLALTPDCRTLATVGIDGTVLLWDVDTERVVRQLTGQSDDAEQVAISPDGRTVAVADGTTAVIWRIDPPY